MLAQGSLMSLVTVYFMSLDTKIIKERNWKEKWWLFFLQILTVRVVWLWLSGPEKCSRRLGPGRCAGSPGSQQGAPFSVNLFLLPPPCPQDVSDLSGIQMCIISHKSMSKRLVENKQPFKILILKRRSCSKRCLNVCL